MNYNSCHSSDLVGQGGLIRPTIFQHGRPHEKSISTPTVSASIPRKQAEPGRASFICSVVSTGLRVRKPWPQVTVVRCAPCSAWLPAPACVRG